MINRPSNPSMKITSMDLKQFLPDNRTSSKHPFNKFHKQKTIKILINLLTKIFLYKRHFLKTNQMRKTENPFISILLFSFHIFLAIDQKGKQFMQTKTSKQIYKPKCISNLSKDKDL